MKRGVDLPLHQSISSLIISFTLLGFSSVQVHAETSPETQATGSSKVQEAAPKTNRLKVDIGFTASTSLHQYDDPDHTASGEVAFAPSIKASENFVIGVSAALTQDFKGLTETKLSDTEIALRRSPWAINDYLGFTPGISWSLPTSTKSREQDTLQGSLRLSPRLKFTFVPSGIPLEGQYTFTYIRNFHDYQTSTTGTSNLNDAVRHRLQPSIPISEKFALSFDFIRTTGWTYKGNPRNTFDVAGEVSFQATQVIALAVGLSNGGDAYKTNGMDPNIAVFNEQSSNAYGSMALTF